MQVSKRFLDRAKANLRRYQKVLESARARDVGESDTCVVISDFLADVLGYDKYSEVTTEFAVKSTFCDLAIRVGGRLRFLIEVKSAGTDLKENHLRQAVDYAANEGVEWVLLTNGARWQAYHITAGLPVQVDLALDVDLLGDGTAAQKTNQLFYLTRESLKRRQIDELWKARRATSPACLAEVLLSEPVLAAVRKELKRTSSCSARTARRWRCSGSGRTRGRWSGRHGRTLGGGGRRRPTLRFVPMVGETCVLDECCQVHAHNSLM